MAPATDAPAAPSSPRDAVDEAAGKDATRSPDSLSKETQSKALSWFLSEDADPDVITDTFEMNVGTKDRPNWISHTVQAIPRERIEQIRKQFTSRRSDGTDEVDNSQSNLYIAVEGLTDPNPSDPQLRGRFADPADALSFRYRRKSGLIDVIAGRVVGCSGYSDDDVREVNAAKN